MLKDLTKQMPEGTSEDNFVPVPSTPSDLTVTDPTAYTLQVEQDIVKEIINAPDKQALERQFALFNNNQVKKNALRIIKLNSLLSKVEDQAMTRIEKRPDQLSNKELLEYINVISNQIEKAQNFNKDTLSNDIGGINIKQEKTEVNINVAPVLDRDNKERVVDVISALLKQMQKPSSTPENVVEAEESPYIDAEVAEESPNTEQNFTYNKVENVLNDESEDN